MVIKVTSSYRTISAEAVNVIAGIPPIILLIDERVRIQARKNNDETINV